MVIFHDVYWEYEWEEIFNTFKGSKAKISVENTLCVYEPLKLMRRFGFGRCLDLEHLEMERCGIFEEEFIRLMKSASHVHLTGYCFGSKLWHTHIHYSAAHSLYMLGLLKDSGYSGLVVSEAKTSLQTYQEFKKLNQFYQEWKRNFLNVK